MKLIINTRLCLHSDLFPSGFKISVCIACRIRACYLLASLMPTNLLQ